MCHPCRTRWLTRWLGMTAIEKCRESRVYVVALQVKWMFWCSINSLSFYVSDEGSNSSEMVSRWHLVTWDTRRNRNASRCLVIIRSQNLHFKTKHMQFSTQHFCFGVDKTSVCSEDNVSSVSPPWVLLSCLSAVIINVWLCRGGL